MPLPTFQTQDEIPEAFRSEYEEKDGVWSAKLPEPEDNSGLKSALEKERKERRDAAKRAKEAEERATLLEAEREASKAGIKPEDLQKLRTTIEAEYKGKLSEAEKHIHELTFGAQLDAAMASANVVDLADGRAVFGARFEMVDGKLVPKDDQSITPAQYFETKLRTEKPHLFRGTQADGGGAGGSRGGKSGAGDNVLAWSEAQRAEFVSANGYDAYREKLNASVVAVATAPKETKQAA